MPQIELSAGTIEYTDTGGGGPVIVLLHGLLMDATLWDEVTGALSLDQPAQLAEAIRELTSSTTIQRR